ncbi:MAG: class I SAM-dependent methyltransferase [Bacteroidales bacterium]|nr:class I SAM-dependent methyltransferase [Bacteroidales bacterium]
MNCKNCNSKNVNLFHGKVWSIDNGKVYRCNDCELIFINPFMNKEEEKEFYKNYNQHVKNRGVTVQNSISEFHEKSKLIAKERLGIVHKFFDNKKILEVGSSTGAFLSLIDNCNTSACELTLDNLEYSKQFISGKAYSSIENVNDKDFDVICMYHVFEHIREPIEFLNICKPLLARGGHFVIEVPCSNDPLITLYNCSEFKDFIFQPMHPMVYNEKSLDYVFEKSGFKKEEVIHHQRYGLENHLSWFKNKKSGEDIELYELFSSNNEYKNKLETIKKTDTIFYIAKVGSVQ